MTNTNFFRYCDGDGQVFDPKKAIPSQSIGQHHTTYNIITISEDVDINFVLIIINHLILNAPASLQIYLKIFNHHLVNLKALGLSTPLGKLR